MSICKSGMDNQFLKAQKIMVEVSPTHPLIKLMNALDWVDLEKLILPDLKKSTSKLKWWLGRKLKVRIHLGVFLLQQLPKRVLNHEFDRPYPAVSLAPWLPRH